MSNKTLQTPKPNKVNKIMGKYSYEISQLFTIDSGHYLEISSLIPKYTA